MIVILRNCGKSWTEIAQEFRAKYNKMMTKRGMQYVWKKYLGTVSVVDKMRTWRHVSVNTVQKILKKYGLRSYTASQKPFLTISQSRRRLTWAKTYGTWDTNKWKAIVFTDECVIQSYSSTRKVRMRTTSNEKYYNTLTQPVMRNWPKIHV